MAGQVRTPGLAVARSAVDEVIRAWEADAWQSWDPFDALASPLLRRLPDDRPRPRQLAIQGVKRSPVNLRPILRVPRLRHIKGLALVVSAMARMHLAGGWPHARETTSQLIPELVRRAARGPVGVGWGYDFDVRTRWGGYRAGKPNAIATAFVTNALLDARAAGLAEVDSNLLDAVIAFVVEGLFVDEGRGGYYAYFPGSRTVVHNASLLLAATVARCGPENADVARTSLAAIQRGITAQSAEGAWPYGEGSSLGWVDGFHSAYNLLALNAWMRSVGSSAFEEHVKRGLSFYRAALVDRDGAPRATVSRRYPVETHAAGTALWLLSEVDPVTENLSLAERVLMWSLKHLRRDDGRFAYQKHRRWTNRAPYLRWNDGHMLLGLSALVRSLERAP